MAEILHRAAAQIEVCLATPLPIIRTYPAAELADPEVLAIDRQTSVHRRGTKDRLLHVVILCLFGRRCAVPSIAATIEPSMTHLAARACRDFQASEARLARCATPTDRRQTKGTAAVERGLAMAATFQQEFNGKELGGKQTVVLRCLRNIAGLVSDRAPSRMRLGAANC